jgi:hypothetical protein
LFIFYFHYLFCQFALIYFLFSLFFIFGFHYFLFLIYFLFSLFFILPPSQNNQRDGIFVKNSHIFSHETFRPSAPARTQSFPSPPKPCRPEAPHPCSVVPMVRKHRYASPPQTLIHSRKVRFLHPWRRRRPPALELRP